MTPRAGVAMVGENKNEKEAKMFWNDPDAGPIGAWLIILAIVGAVLGALVYWAF